MLVRQHFKNKHIKQNFYNIFKQLETKMNNQKTCLKVLHLSKLNCIDFDDRHKEFTHGKNLAKMSFKNSSSTMRSTLLNNSSSSVLDPHVSYVERSTSLTSDQEQIRRLNIELNAVREKLNTVQHVLNKPRKSRPHWRLCDQVEIKMRDDLPLTQVQIDREKDQSQFVHGKVINQNYQKTKHYVSNIPTTSALTRPSGSGLSIVPPKRNVIPQGDGIKHPSIKFQTTDIQPPMVEGVDVYGLWVDAGMPNTLNVWATEQGYWFKNAKEKRAYTAKFGAYDRVKLRCYRGDEDSQKYDFSNYKDDDDEALWDEDPEQAAQKAADFVASLNKPVTPPRYEAQVLGITEGKEVLQKIAASMPKFDTTLNAVTTLCNKLSVAVDAVTDKVSAFPNSEKWLGWFVDSAEIGSLIIKISTYVYKITQNSWRDLTVSLLLDIATAISGAIKHANDKAAHDLLVQKNALLLEEKRSLIEELSKTNALLEKYEAKYGRMQTESIGDILSHPLFSLAANFGNHMTHLRVFNTIMTALRNGVCIFSKLKDLIPQCVLELLGLATDSVILTSASFEEFAAEAHPILERFTIKPSTICDVPREKLEKLYAKALDFQKQASMAYNKGRFTTTINYVLRQLTDILLIYDDREQLSFERLNPFAILLCGPPRTGKSEVAKKIANNIHDWLNDERLSNVTALQKMGANKTTYSHQSHLEYMDGYAKQGVIIVDELGARNDGEDLDSLFSMASSNTYVCPMATLNNPIIGKKGTTFTSHTIIACSNKDDFNHLNGTFHTPEAITQRFVFRIEVTALEGVARRADFGHLRFRLINFNSGESYTLSQLLYILKEHKNGFFNFFLTRSNIDYSVIPATPVDMNFGCTDVQKETYQTKYRAFGGMDIFAAGEMVAGFCLCEYALSHSMRVGMTYAMTNNYWRTAIIALKGILCVGAFVFVVYCLSAARNDNRELTRERDNLQGAVDVIMDAYARLAKTVSGAYIVDELKMITESRSGKNINPRRVNARSMVTQVENERVRQDALDVIGLLKKCDDNKEVLNDLEEFAEFIRKLPISPEPNNIPFQVSRVPPTAAGVKKMHTQSVGDSAATSLETKLLHYMLHFKLMTNEINYWICAIPLNHVTCVLPSHFFRHAQQNDFIEVTWYGGDRTQTFSMEELTVVHLKQDIAIVTLPTLKWRFPNMLKNFVRESELPMLNESYGTLVSVNSMRRGFAKLYSTHLTTLSESRQYFDPEDVNDESPLELITGFAYNVNSEIGDCGSPLVLHNKDLRGKIVGMHVAGSLSEACGMGTLLTFEMLNPHVEIPNNYLEDRCVVAGRMVMLGRTERKLNVNRKTAFYRTKFNVVPPVKEPADLGFYNGDDRILTAMMKNAVEVEQGRISDKTLEVVVQHIASKFPPDRDTHILTPMETLAGYKSMDSINLKTSPGYPYVLDHRKTDFFVKELDGSVTIKDPSIFSDLERIECQSKHQPPDIFWMSSGKDELKKPGKLCRVFEIAPLHFTMLGRRYFGAFLNYIQENPGVLYSMIGVNPESFAWSRMYNRLAKISGYGYAWDWNKYDSTIKTYLMERFVQLVNLWYDDEFSEIRRNIGRALMTRPTIYGGMVLLASDGNPSGHFATSVSNSFIQVIIIMSFWYDTAPMIQRDLFWFDKLIGLAVYGDDSVVAVSSSANWFSFDSFGEYVQKIGMSLQLDTKEEGTTSRRHLTELTFLKRAFARDYRGTIVPQLNWESMISMLHWNRKSKYSTTLEIYNTNCLVFSQFLYFYGEEKYKEITSKFALKVPSYDYYDGLFYSGLDFPIKY